VREKITRLPLFAIGGIGPDNVAEVMETGIRRVAVSSAVIGAPDVRAAAQRIRKHLPPRPDSE
jgi:thiamine-phosphate pyrophosphorylase